MKLIGRPRAVGRGERVCREGAALMTLVGSSRFAVGRGERACREGAALMKLVGRECKHGA